MNIYSIFLNEEVEPQKDLAKKSLDFLGKKLNATYSVSEKGNTLIATYKDKNGNKLCDVNITVNDNIKVTKVTDNKGKPKQIDLLIHKINDILSNKIISYINKAKKIDESSLIDYGLDVNGFYKYINGKESIVETDDFKIKITYDSANPEFDGDNEELLLKMHCNIIELRHIVTGIEDAMRISDEINDKIVGIIKKDLKKYDDISKYLILVDSGVFIDPDDPFDYIEDAYIIIQPKL
ncbi:hypothetical protein [Campylobacter phage CP81]|uniref:Uncharacterized protein n=4 Tax=Fletchervirus TaxID=1636618 RepID=G8GJ02_9CAUD|nr:hypothetical protein CaPhCPX_gp090 [Campylobacter phage CPX]YP_006908213.1 hypothetical protein D302_gp151 [Campylobacter phage CP30A]YP_009623291.1 hypothetical protein FDJ37_gp065 [Campylobacter phage CP81]AGS81260.1 hypothetical protein [Campylobacter phage CP8]AET34387.1 hypothetical protein [Campylobacter phage CPX]AFR52463.1 hypothetical protein [Campylobacter phage CP30A]CBZ42232.1 hypothetical protein [Campylobacter phage CP81]